MYAFFKEKNKYHKCTGRRPFPPPPPPFCAWNQPPPPYFMIRRNVIPVKVKLTDEITWCKKVKYVDTRSSVSPVWDVRNKYKKGVLTNCTIFILLIMNVFSTFENHPVIFRNEIVSWDRPGVEFLEQCCWAGPFSVGSRFQLRALAPALGVRLQL